VGILHDITESRRLFEIVEQIFERGSSPMIMVLVAIGAILRCVSVALSASPFPQINSQGIIQKYNECAEKVFGYSKEEAIGQNIKLLMPPDVADKHDGYLYGMNLHSRSSVETQQLQAISFARANE
jgi:PAS domain-containing protein